MVNDPLRDHSDQAVRSLPHLKRLEDESIHILREVSANFVRPAILFSGGKDSITVAHLAKKAFAPLPIPFPLLHVDTGHNFEETIQYRDAFAKEYGAELVVRLVEDSIRLGRAQDEVGEDASRNAIQSVTLMDAIRELSLDACIGGARRDEEKARAKERIFSVRGASGSWETKRQRPEFFGHYNTLLRPGEHMRVFPLSNWTELDVWQYLALEKVSLPSLYFSHQRSVFFRNGAWMPWIESVHRERFNIRPRVEVRSVRFRTVGDITCTAAVESEATEITDVINEISASLVSERGARMDDKRREGAMELRKKEGYF